MSITVGTLIVDLQANTASFVTGLDKAGQIALTSTKNIQKAFENMAEAVGAAVLAVEAALADMVDKAIENASRLYDMAQATGVSVAALSALEFVAKQSGVSVEAMDNALGKMAKTMLAAATGTGKGADAYKQLGVQVTAANGQLRPTQDVLADLAEKFKTMPDGPLKTADAMLIFGKAGKELVPLLNRGKDGITDLMNEAKKLGLVLDDSTAAAAKKFDESMNLLKAAGTGVANSLMKELLPAMQTIVDQMNAGAGEQQNKISDFLSGAATLLKVFISIVDVAWSAISTISRYVEQEMSNTIIATRGLAQAAGDAMSGNWKAVIRDLADTNTAINENNDKASKDVEKTWVDTTLFLDNLFSKAVQPGVHTPPKGGGNTPSLKDPSKVAEAQIAADESVAKAREQLNKDTQEGDLKTQLIRIDAAIATANKLFQVDHEDFNQKLALLQQREDAEVASQTNLVNIERKGLSDKLAVLEKDPTKNAAAIITVNGQLAALEITNQDALLKIHQKGADDRLRVEDAEDASEEAALKHTLEIKRGLLQEETRFEQQMIQLSSAQKQSQAAFDLRMGVTNAQQNIEILKTLAAEELAQEKAKNAALRAEMQKNDPNYTVNLQKNLDDDLKMQQEYYNKLAVLDQNSLEEKKKTFMVGFDAMNQGMSTLVSDLITGNGNILADLKGTLQKMLTAWIDHFIQVKLQAFETWLFMKLLGLFVGGGAAGLPAGGVLGPGGALSLGDAGNAWGGPVAAGSPYMVGEQGREWFVPSTSGSIVPDSRMGYGADGVAGQMVNQYFNFSFPNANPDTFRASQSQIQAAVASSMAHAARRN